jgi:septum formation protein
MGLRIEIVPSRYDEVDLAGCTPAALAAFHARGKAREVFARYPGRIVVGADTVVDLDGTALGKPRDEADAARMLRALSGREHVVHSAFCVVAGDAGRTLESSASTCVRFYPLEEHEIEAYVASGEPFDKAGAYGIQGRGAIFVERIDGDFYTVMGFPLALFARSLGELGFALPSSTARR